MALIDTATSETLSARSAHARQRSTELRQRSQELLAQNAALLTRSLDQLTEIADMEGEAVSPQRADRLRQLSERVGRDPAIERAKVLLRERYGINGAEAFELLRHISQNRNRKIRDIAREMVTRAERTARSDMSRRGSRPEAV